MGFPIENRTFHELVSFLEVMFAVGNVRRSLPPDNLEIGRHLTEKASQGFPGALFPQGCDSDMGSQAEETLSIPSLDRSQVIDGASPPRGLLVHLKAYLR